jgi:hypothetical protein
MWCAGCLHAVHGFVARSYVLDEMMQKYLAIAGE